jgi:hypothetical protein
MLLITIGVPFGLVMLLWCFAPFQRKGTGRFSASDGIRARFIRTRPDMFAERIKNCAESCHAAHHCAFPR